MSRTMNQYGQRAMTYWREHLPTRYAQLPDPETHFAEVGEDLAQQIHDLADTIAGPDQPGEGYLDKLGRLNEARMAAEAEVMREALPESEATPENPPESSPTTQPGM